MPLFEYECKTCGTKFEQLVFDRTAKIACKSCGGSKVVQLLSTFAVATAESTRKAASEPGPCGTCGAPQRGMCETIN